MVSIEATGDILSLGIANILQYRKDESEFTKLLENWNKVIVVEFRDIYGVTVTFNAGNIKIDYDYDQYDLKIQLDIQTMVDLAKGDEGVIRGFLKGRIKVKKVWKVGVLLKFIKLFIPNLKLAGESAAKFLSGGLK